MVVALSASDGKSSERSRFSTGRPSCMAAWCRSGTTIHREMRCAAAPLVGGADLGEGGGTAEQAVGELHEQVLDELFVGEDGLGAPAHDLGAVHDHVHNQTATRRARAAN